MLKNWKQFTQDVQTVLLYSSLKRKLKYGGYNCVGSLAKKKSIEYKTGFFLWLVFTGTKDCKLMSEKLT